MSRELTLRQRATDFEGRPNRRALVALGGVVLVAFVGGFLLHPGGDDAPAAIPAQRLTSDAAPARESAATPALRGTAAFPALREEPRRRTRAQPRQRAAAEPATPAATPTPALTTDDTAAPTPDPVTPATPAPAPAAPAPAGPAPAPKPARPAPPTQSFDSTG